MTMLQRRGFLMGSTALTGVALLAAACQNSSVTPAQVIADASGIVDQLSITIPAMAAAAPTLLPPGPNLTKAEDGLALAKQLLASLTAQTPAPAAASTLSVVEGYINAAVNAVAVVTPAAAAAFPALAPYVLVLQASLALVPLIEAFINSVPTIVTQPTPTPTPVSPAAKALAPSSMSPAKARSVLKIPTV